MKVPVFTPSLTNITKQAGRIIMEYYRKDSSITLKTNQSPVTLADLAADEFIRIQLQIQFPDIPVITEETYRDSTNTFPETFFLVDPLDGTKEFIKGTDEFTVNIGLIHQGRPIAGSVTAPATQETFWVDEDGKAKHEDHLGQIKVITVRPFLSLQSPVTAVSRSHLDQKTIELLMRLGIQETLPFGSSLKICRIAQGVVHFYPRLGTTMEWDTAAAHAVLLAAGGTIWTHDLEILSYGKPGLKNPFFFAIGGEKFLDFGLTQSLIQEILEK